MGCLFREKVYLCATFKTENMRFNKVLAIAFCGILFAFFACKRETKDESWKRIFEQYTEKECPKFVDPCTRLDSASYDIETRTLSYFYTVQDELDNESIYSNEDMTSSFHDTILKGLRGSLQMKPYKDEGITFCYDYYSISSGKKLFNLTFTPEDYN